jgi:hypothetical protein
MMSVSSPDRNRSAMRRVAKIAVEPVPNPTPNTGFHHLRGLLLQPFYTVPVIASGAGSGLSVRW